jgi:hypothetical protein
MWKCVCGEEVEDQFDKCWKCGRDKEGKQPDSSFEYERRCVMPDKLAGSFEMLEGEEQITHISGLCLTNIRLAYMMAIERGMEAGSVMIKDVDTASIRTRRPHLALVIVGAILALMGIYLLSEGGRSIRPLGILIMLGGATMVVLFFVLKKKILRFTVYGESWFELSVSELGSSESVVLDFIDRFFKAKYSLLNQNQD